MQKKKWHCLKRSEISENDYLIRAVQENDIENIRVWRNLQIDVLRQKGKISKSEQPSEQKPLFELYRSNCVFVFDCCAAMPPVV